jgi:signal transduction histidine kinase
MLAAAGHVVIESASASQALLDFEHYQPAIVLLEENLRKTGPQLRNLHGGRATPIVLLVDGAIDEQTVRKWEADDFLRKPIERTALLLRVATLLQLVAQRDSLHEDQRHRQELAAHVTHDLRLPLTSISASLQWLLRDQQLSEQATGAARDALDACDTALHMAADVLDLAIADQGELVAHLQPIDLAAMLEDVRRQALRRMEGEIQHQIVLSIRLEQPKIAADRLLLRRLLENLLDNAIKYAPSCDTIQIEARTFSPEWIELRVRDHGPGVPEAYREAIFQQYVQLDRAVELHLRGSRGLGLAFCKVAAHAHGGRLWVEDNQPRGACFCVQLPQVRDGSVHR